MITIGTLGTGHWITVAWGGIIRGNPSKLTRPRWMDRCIDSSRIGWHPDGIEAFAYHCRVRRYMLAASAMHADGVRVCMPDGLPRPGKKGGVIFGALHCLIGMSVFMYVIVI